jgi:GNAT superfamily N-acetyltransferase
MSYLIRQLEAVDREAWEPLWHGYQAFYKRVVSQEITDTAWERFLDPTEPMHALGAFDGEKLLGITHYLFHRSCLTVGPSCYLQDLFTVSEARGRGVGRALIEAVYTAAKLQNAGRVYWLTHETNAEAMVLYNKVAERSGFLMYRMSI